MAGLFDDKAPAWLTHHGGGGWGTMREPPVHESRQAEGPDGDDSSTTPEFVIRLQAEVAKLDYKVTVACNRA